MIKHSRIAGFLNCLVTFLTFFALSISQENIRAQTAIPLTDLSFFKTPGASWRLAGDVNADIEKINFLSTMPGTGILVNLPDQKTHGEDLYTQLQHGDADIELDYMMAKGSNSGVYLQGRYEIQLLDSWGVKRSGYGDNGGIYERWDDARGKGNEGFQGYAPRQNASFAPGLWQHLKISFQAPRFDAAGKKTENARILRVELNGVTVHENAELSGVTRGSVGEEVKAGPLRIQGDHGAVAFKNIVITNYDKPRPELTNLRYSIYKGKFKAEPDFKKLPPEAEGSSVVLSSNLDNNLTNEYLIRYTGDLKIEEQGEYNFDLNVPGGEGSLKINNQVAVPVSGWRGAGKIKLPAGNHSFELLYAKIEDWAKPALGLSIAGPGIREYLISDANTGSSDQSDPILVDAASNPVLRSFMDIPKANRIVHAVSVGSTDNVHYTYDMDKGSIVQMWRGGFLDATPMWNDRGDGSSRPVGALKYLGNSSFMLARMSSAQQPWITDSSGTGYKPKGYELDNSDRPIFHYIMYGAAVSDAIRVMENGHGLQRDITVEAAPSELYMCLSKASKIESLGNGVYVMDDKSYYLRINDSKVTPVIRDNNGAKELIIPVQNKFSYSIIF